VEVDKSKIKSSGSLSFFRKIIPVLIRIIISALILYFLISLIQWENVLSAYKTANLIYILLASIFLIANLGIRIFKWRIMIKSVKKGPTFKEAFMSVMLGISLGSFTPGEVGEFAGRILHISDVKRSHLIGLTLLDKAQIFIITTSFGLISLSVLMIENPYWTFIFSILTVFIFLFFALKMNIIAAMGHRINASFFDKPWLTRVIDGFSMLNRGQLLTTLLCTTIFHLVIIIQIYFLLNAFENISFINSFIGMSAMMFVKSLLPISLGDLGIREAGAIYFFSHFSISNAAALNGSLLLFFINIFIPSVIGIFFLRHQSLSINSLFLFLKNISVKKKQ
jgi:uncharacterized protein (TIRG00374 family)